MSSNKRKLRKIFLMFLLIFITTVVLIYETYAWFTGISLVSVNPFTVSVSTDYGLELSLDGENWSSSSLTIPTESPGVGQPPAIESIYSGNTNKWSTALVPVSTAGLINSTSSKLEIFQKDSLSATAGGFRIVSSQVQNSSTEQDGYIAFDLFIRNGKGSSYSSTYNEDNAENIYLAANSNAAIPITGSTNYGLQNSVRIGFFSLGRVKTGTAVNTIRGISCTSNSNVTSLCTTDEYLTSRNGVTWNIWEPNYAHHTTALTTYYNQLCRLKDNDTTSPNYGSYTTNLCHPLETNSYRRTYAIKAATTIADNIDIYDGGELNGYTGNWNTTTNSSAKLKRVETYKTNYASQIGDQKPSLLKLAPNSITKVRVYIWLEGQDIDNYDVITQDQPISINFGLTKDAQGMNSNNVNNPTTGRASSFEDDSWSEIQTNIRNNNTSQYNVGDTRAIKTNGKTYTLRLANKTNTGTICSGSTNSQTACGFVIEFADSCENVQMNSTVTNAGGWQDSEARSYMNEVFYNNLPSDLKEVITTTRVVSGHGSQSGSTDYTTNDRIYYLSLKEIFSDVTTTQDSAANKTRQLDYYEGKSTTISNPTYAKKVNESTAIISWWWTRTATSSNSTGFYRVQTTGVPSSSPSDQTVRVAPAFRIA